LCGLQALGFLVVGPNDGECAHGSSFQLPLI
jgi:hypothetical protein